MSEHPLDDPTMRDDTGRPLDWLRCILAHRDRIERFIRSLHGGPSAVGYTTKQLLGADPVRRAHHHLVNHYAPRRLWCDPVV